MITLQQLEYIIAVDKHRHFIKASEHCFVTQPTLSMQIKKLEEDLGVLIFDRSKQPIIPTQVGEKIIKQAKQTLFETNKISEIIKEEEKTISGTLNIGIIPSLSPYLLPRFIGKFVKKYPQLNVTLKEMLSEEIIEGLKRDDIDVGILVTPLNEKGIYETPVFYEQMYLYVNPSHPYHNDSTILTKNIRTKDLWLMSKGNCFRTQVENLCNLDTIQNTTHEFKFESGSLETLVNLVDSEGGYTLLPELAIQDQVRKNNIRSFSDIIPTREVGLAFSRTNVKSKLLKLLVSEILDSIPDHMKKLGESEVIEWR
jgi:LysR family hydrogen peroxide-inducible transcriptional activator